MLRSVLFASTAVFLAGCGEPAPSVSHIPVAEVQTAVETVPVRSIDDAADDPAIWINPEDAGQSLIIGTDKDAGLWVYDLTGAEVQFLEWGEVNNVDIRQGLTGIYDTLGATSNRTHNATDIFAMSNTGTVTLLGRVPTGKVEPYGLCIARSASGESITVFVNYKDGLIQAWDVALSEDGAATATLAATDQVPSQTEGCVAHESSDTLYLGEEAGGIWKYKLSEFGQTSPELFATVQNGDSGLVVDVEGLAIFDTPEGPRLIASSQGDHSYVVFDPAGDGTALLKFRTVTEPGTGSEQTNETDGLDVTATALGDAFPRGVLVVQDGDNAPDAQNFKLIDLGQIIDLLPVTSTSP